MADENIPVSQSADSPSPSSKPPSSQPSSSKSSSLKPPWSELSSSELSSSKSSSPKPPSSEPSSFQFPSQVSSTIDPPIAPILAEIARDHPDELWEAALAYHGCSRTEKPEEKSPRWTCCGLRPLISRSMGMLGVIVFCLAAAAILTMIFVYVPITQASSRKHAKTAVSSSEVPFNTELSTFNTTASASTPSITAAPALAKHERRSPSSLIYLTSPATSRPVASIIPSLLPASRSLMLNIGETSSPVRSIPHSSQELSSSSALRTGVPPWSESTFRILPITTGRTPSTTFATRPLRSTQPAMPTPGTTALKEPMTINLAYRYH
ncbi:hypothetical protein N7474_003533 [Penicillium riverlandense]|uniref:uncharacterized protein n=1 Tax=Penicillium riverlandense TaxID=1903569 RepID=UPI00254831F2|nr:uncharacterized protein N7474_003533 [Penicillium riverlandense]KAJ5826395.1 hypothetical protein N7474_003533 [Penicillium riverlandense]